MKMGVVDWGIGGLDAWRRIRAALPGIDVAYWSDAGFTPYGKVPAPALHERLCEVVERMAVDVIVVACNAASTVLDRPLPVPALGVIAPGIRLALSSGLDTLAVLGGDRTIDSGLHARALEAAGRRVIAVRSQPLSAHVEAGRLDGPALLADLEPRCRAIAEAQGALLACTHYPALLPTLERLLPRMTWLDPIDALVAEVVERWGSSRAVAGLGSTRLHTTGDPGAMRLGAHRAYGLVLGAIEAQPMRL